MGCRKEKQHRGHPGPKEPSRSSSSLPQQIKIPEEFAKQANSLRYCPAPEDVLALPPRRRRRWGQQTPVPGPKIRAPPCPSCSKGFGAGKPPGFHCAAFPSLGLAHFFYSCWLVFSPSRAGGVDAVLIIFDSKQSQEEEEEKKKEKKNRKKRKNTSLSKNPHTNTSSPLPACSEAQRSARDGFKRNSYGVKGCRETRPWEVTAARIT